jgi:hypothetical protein
MQTAEKGPETDAGAARRGGFSMREYELRVWDMAKHQIHPTFLYVVAQVAGASRLLSHPAFEDRGGSLREVALFLAGFLGAWGCFYSTLLRVAGLRSLTVTIVVPAAVLAAAAIWFVLPAPEAMSRKTLAFAEAALVVPGAAGWALTMRRWRAARREAQEQS